MGEGRHNVLLIGGVCPLVRAAVPLLRRSDFDVHRIPPEEGVVGVVTDTPFDLLIVEVEALPVPLQQLVRAVRDAESPCHSAGLIVIAEEAIRPAVPELLKTGVNRVVFRSASAGELLHAVADLLAVAPRHELRAIVQLEGRVGGQRNRTLAQIANLSKTGMLVRGGHNLPIGAEIEFELMLPGQALPIRGRAEVVRQTTRRREAHDGFGARFGALESDGAKRIETFLATHH